MAKKTKAVDTTEKPTEIEASEEKKDTEQYLVMVAEAAYYKAESRGFEAGHEMEDWIEAEKEILVALEKS